MHYDLGGPRGRIGGSLGVAPFTIERALAKEILQATIVEWLAQLPDVNKDLKNIPAEIIAEHVVKGTRPEDLFQIAKRLEHLSFSRVLTSFDALGIEDKAFIAMLLDYNGVDRSRFASCWSAEVKKHRDIERANPEDGPLFSDKRYGSDR
jgi:hypothetical protein